MVYDPDGRRPSPERYRERELIIRQQVERVSNAEVRRQLLDIAERYEERADGIERPRRDGGTQLKWGDG